MLRPCQAPTMEERSASTSRIQAKPGVPGPRSSFGGASRQGDAEERARWKVLHQLKERLPRRITPTIKTVLDTTQQALYAAGRLGVAAGGCPPRLEPQPTEPGDNGSSPQLPARLRIESTPSQPRASDPALIWSVTATGRLAAQQDARCGVPAGNTSLLEHPRAGRRSAMGLAAKPCQGSPVRLTQQAGALTTELKQWFQGSGIGDLVRLQRGPSHSLPSGLGHQDFTPCHPTPPAVREVPGASRSLQSTAWPSTASRGRSLPPGAASMPGLNSPRPANHPAGSSFTAFQLPCHHAPAEAPQRTTARMAPVQALLCLGHRRKPAWLKRDPAGVGENRPQRRRSMRIGCQAPQLLAWTEFGGRPPAGCAPTVCRRTSCSAVFAAAATARPGTTRGRPGLPVSADQRRREIKGIADAIAGPAAAAMEDHPTMNTPRRHLWRCLRAGAGCCGSTQCHGIAKALRALQLLPRPTMPAAMNQHAVTVATVSTLMPTDGPTRSGDASACSTSP